MNTEKRGSEKLLQMEDDLRPLTAEELEQVAGGAAHKNKLGLTDYFPIGILPPDLWDMGGLDKLKDRLGGGNLPRQY